MGQGSDLQRNLIDLVEREKDFIALLGESLKHLHSISTACGVLHIETILEP